MAGLDTPRIPEKPRVRWSSGLLLLAVAMTGCAGSRAVRTDHSPALADRLRQEVRTWEGTPHVWGGETRSGADCSGFVMRLYDDVMGISLPRTTEDQAREGREVPAGTLVPGDLVFFRTAPKTRHVGIYLSDGEFAHASSSEGVRVSGLDEDYWRRTYWMSRRIAGGLTSNREPAIRSPEAASIIPPSESVAASEAPSRSTASPPERASRVGW